MFLFGRRKRAKWGVVYNALTKLPVDLAVVRLVDVKTGRVIRSRVTDSEGRYAFLRTRVCIVLRLINRVLFSPPKF